MITMISRGCWWEKCTQRFVREEAVPYHPSKGHQNWVRMAEKGHPIMLWFHFPDSSFSLPPAPHQWVGGVASPLPTPCWSWWWAVNDPAARMIPHSVNVPAAVAAPYTRVPYLSLAKCMPLLTMREGCDMSNQTPLQSNQLVMVKWAISWNSPNQSMMMLLCMLTSGCLRIE